ncbi:hypothetical protein [uncultured Aquimarina sp.]|uniref:hypothetical protein n=1 Tax=uncultured Aquimarina sp. TaxID=575652 RepID=UPI002621B9C4|nr:hypothetical protein [uncultured Aquimarina sp.]
MKTGILKTLLFYGIGFGIAGIAYAIIGNPYIHAPGVHHLILFLTLVIGIIWVLISIGFFFFKAKTDKLKGIIITNSIIILSCFLYVAIPIYLDSTEKTFIESDFVRTEIKGDTTKLYHNNNLIFIKVKDSVILDLRK